MRWHDRLPGWAQAIIGCALGTSLALLACLWFVP
jgi:hypothetical protein